MKKHFGWSVASALLVGTMGSAFAADIPLKAPPPVVPVYNWTGWYIGLNAGGAFGETDPWLFVDDSRGNYYTFGAGQAANVQAVRNAAMQRFDNSGFTGGGQFGALWQTGRFVYGFEGDFEYFNPKGSRTVNGALPALAGQTCANSGGGCPFTITENSSGSWLSTLRLRAGVARDTLLFYGTAGVAFAHLKYSATYADATTSPPQISAALRSNFSSSQDRVGPVVGAGLEYAFAPNWTIRGEYLFLYFNDIAHNGSDLAVPTAGTIPAPGVCPPSGPGGFCSVFNHDARLLENVARVAINYKFGAAPVVAKY